MPELSRKDKETARTIIEKGLQKEIENGIGELEQLITQWKQQRLSNQEAWRQLFQSIKKHDKHIALRYDGLSGSRYDVTLASQLKEGIIDPSDLDGLEEETRTIIVHWSTVA